MSTPSPTPTAPKTGFRWTPRRIVMAAVAVYGLILILLNLNHTKVNFVFFSTSAPLFVLILLSLGVGFALGWLFDDIRARRKRKPAG